MTTEEALLAAIWAAPHDDLPRLVYADFLEETGDRARAARAEFIRVQCELDGVPGDDARYDHLQARAADLEKQHGKAWKAAMPSGARYGHFDRGFLLPSLERYSFDGLWKVKAELLRAAPLWRYHYGLSWDQAARLLDWDGIARFGMLAFQAPAPGGWAGVLSACDRLGNVSDLQIIGCQPDTADLGRVLDAWTDRRLETLRFDPTRLDIAGFRLLATHPTTRRLRCLILEGDPTTPPPGSLPALLAGPSLGSLVWLSLNRLEFPPEELDVLPTWPGLRRLRALFVCDAGVRDAFASRLAASPNAVNLRKLMLSQNHITSWGARALSESPHLSRDTYVSLYNNPALLDEPTRKLLKRRFKSF